MAKIKKEASKAQSTMKPWLVFVALVIVGTGIGAIFNRYDIGSMIGAGVGFLAVFWLKSREK